METGTKDSPGLESVREQIKSATVGKTIESIELSTIRRQIRSYTRMSDLRFGSPTARTSAWKSDRTAGISSRAFRDLIRAGCG